MSALNNYLDWIRRGCVGSADPDRRFEFFLGTHMPHWLWDPQFEGTRLFVSYRTLSERVSLFPATVNEWGLDSNGFTEIQMFGAWTVPPEEYLAAVHNYTAKIGQLVMVSPQDWMCEPQVIGGLVQKKRGKRPRRIDVETWLAWARAAGPALAGSVRQAELLGADAEVLFHGTGLSVLEHQRRTVDNFLLLRKLAPTLPIIPVLQGWTLADYWRCAEMYEAAGVRLRDEPRVGLGSVCRRQDTDEAAEIVEAVASEGYAIHGYGFKIDGVARCWRSMRSSDSLAWSKNARYDAPLPGHDRPGPGRPYGHKNCANCPDYARQWGRRVESVAR